jgi:hypothetical protein
MGMQFFILKKSLGGMTKCKKIFYAEQVRLPGADSQSIR